MPYYAPRAVLTGLLLGIALTIETVAVQTPFSDPVCVSPPPVDAIGFPNRAADLDVSPGFRKPPPAYGIVLFFRWLGDPLAANPDANRGGGQADEIPRRLKYHDEMTPAAGWMPQQRNPGACP